MFNQSVFSPPIALILALVFAGLAGGLWYYYVRPVPDAMGTGIITGKTFYPAERVEKSVPRTTRSLEQTPYELKYDLPDRYAFRIRLDGKDFSVVYTAPALESQGIDIGTRVTVVYEERSLPLTQPRFLVKHMAKH